MEVIMKKSLLTLVALTMVVSANLVAGVMAPVVTVKEDVISGITKKTYSMTQKKQNVTQASVAGLRSKANAEVATKQAVADEAFDKEVAEKLWFWQMPKLGLRLRQLGRGFKKTGSVVVSAPGIVVRKTVSATKSAASAVASVPGKVARGTASAAKSVFVNAPCAVASSVKSGALTVADKTVSAAKSVKSFASKPFSKSVAPTTGVSGHETALSEQALKMAEANPGQEIVLTDPKTGAVSTALITPSVAKILAGPVVSTVKKSAPRRSVAPTASSRRRVNRSASSGRVYTMSEYRALVAAAQAKNTVAAPVVAPVKIDLGNVEGSLGSKFELPAKPAAAATPAAESHALRNAAIGTGVAAVGGGIAAAEHYQPAAYVAVTAKAKALYNVYSMATMGQWLYAKLPEIATVTEFAQNPTVAALGLGTAACATAYGAYKAYQNGMITKAGLKTTGKYALGAALTAGAAYGAYGVYQHGATACLEAATDLVGQATSKIKSLMPISAEETARLAAEKVRLAAEKVRLAAVSDKLAAKTAEETARLAALEAQPLQRIGEWFNSLGTTHGLHGQAAK